MTFYSWDNIRNSISKTFLSNLYKTILFLSSKFKITTLIQFLFLPYIPNTNQESRNVTVHSVQHLNGTSFSLNKRKVQFSFYRGEILTGLWAGRPKIHFQLPIQERAFLLLQNLQDGIWAFQTSYSVNLPVLQRSNCKANHLPQSSTKVMNGKYSTSTLPFSFILFTGIIFYFNYLEKIFKYIQELNFVHFPCKCVHMWNFNK